LHGGMMLRGQAVVHGNGKGIRPTRERLCARDGRIDWRGSLRRRHVVDLCTHNGGRCLLIWPGPQRRLSAGRGHSV
jgi:hypothetical protein